ncbi:MAG: exonuclease domain-containing protein [Candidatus Omnitrophota bacterium]|jgi:DNA polymerase III epsilon subunit family exonuclease
MHRDIDDIEFSIFDTETTGLDPEGGDRIIEIAAVRFKGPERIADFQSLINPRRAVSEAAFEVNRISEDMLSDAPLAEEVIPRFLEFTKNSCLCSYNAPFDLGFLNNEIRTVVRAGDKTGSFLTEIPFSSSGIAEEKVVIDILKMAKRLLPGMPRYALWFVAQQLGVDREQKHRAFSDVELTLAVFFRFKEMLRKRGIIDFLNFSSLFGVGPGFLDNVISQRIAKIQEALNLGARVKLRYLSSSTAIVTEREVLPKQIRQERNRNYLVGYCCLRKEERAFRVDNILNIELL